MCIMIRDLSVSWSGLNTLMSAEGGGYIAGHRLVRGHSRVCTTVGTVFYENDFYKIRNPCRELKGNVQSKASLTGENKKPQLKLRFVQITSRRNAGRG
jgi:hypothetical protein